MKNDAEPTRRIPGSNRGVAIARSIVGLFGLAALSASPMDAQAAPPYAVCGTYEHVYPHNTELLDENHFIVFDVEGERLRGWYYGTSDDFDPGREGYLPGFFVAEMDSLAVTESALTFALEVRPDEYFATPVPLSFRGAEEIPEGRLEAWTHAPAARPRPYLGTVSADAIVLDVDGASRIFHRVVPPRDRESGACPP